MQYHNFFLSPTDSECGKDKLALTLLELLKDNAVVAKLKATMFIF